MKTKIRGKGEYITPAEGQVLAEIVKGKTFRQIAVESHRSPRTVRNLMTNARQRNDCATTAQLVYKATRFGWID